MTIRLPRRTATTLICALSLGLFAGAAANAEDATFDPAKPVTVFFTRLGGETTSTVGVLPLHHAVVVGDLEYRFSVVAGSRSFAEVTGQSCVYP